MASVAKGLFGGQLPWTMIAIGAGIGALVIALDEFLKARGSNFRVPVLGAAIGIYLPLELMVPIFLGGLLTHLVERKHKVDPRDEERRDRIHRPARRHHSAGAEARHRPGGARRIGDGGPGGDAAADEALRDVVQQVLLAAEKVRGSGDVDPHAVRWIGRGDG